MKNPRLTKEKIAELLNRLANGAEARQLALDYNVSVATI